MEGGRGQSDWMKSIHELKYDYLQAAEYMANMKEKPGEFAEYLARQKYELWRQDRRSMLRTLNLPWCRQFKLEACGLADILKTKLGKAMAWQKVENRIYWAERSNKKRNENNASNAMTALMKIQHAI